MITGEPEFSLPDGEMMGYGIILKFIIIRFIIMVMVNRTQEKAFFGLLEGYIYFLIIFKMLKSKIIFLTKIGDFKSVIAIAIWRLTLTSKIFCLKKILRLART